MKTNYLFVLLLAAILVSPGVFAAAPSHKVTITGYPTVLRENLNLSITWTLADPTNDTQNVTAKLFVNGANVANDTDLNVITNNTASNSSTFSHTLYAFGDVVYVNFVTTESANASNTNQTNSTSWTVIESSSSLIAQDTLSGLPSVGTGMGDFMGNMSSGLFRFILFMGLAVGIVAVIVAVGALIKSKANFGGGAKK